ncbi:hypothetical protein HYC85_028051 [Camellia sinensis]|uniref:Uncharacterized protein n=1 Tax=Camellia sinensis TaxID=4442 RepID=A0A7J7FU15_CAMSI|nr:hypothetical protein HYC85_028051 [Camellia sinensis]
MISFIKGLARLSFSQFDQSFANPEEFLPLCFHRNVQKVLKNSGYYNDFKAQKRQSS